MGSDKDRFYALFGELVVSGMNRTAVVQLLGYAGNPGRNFKVVVDGRSKTSTLPEAIKLLEAELKKRDQTKAPSQKAAAAADGLSSSDPEPDDGAASAAGAASAEGKQNPHDDFALSVAALVEGFERKDEAPLKMPDPVCTTLTLSAWYHAVEKVNASPFKAKMDAAKLKRDQASRAKLLGDEVHRVFRETESRVSLWMLDGAGHIVFQLLAHLLTAGWTDAELDAQLELSLVDWNKAMNDYHAYAIPCATVRRGNIHTLIEAARDASALPQVVYFNYSITTTNGTKKAMYEEGSWPMKGAKYSTADCMEATAASCRTVLYAFPQAGLLVGFSACRGGKHNHDKFLEAIRDRMKAKDVKTHREAFETWQVTRPARQPGAPSKQQQAAAADDSSPSDAEAQDGAASAAGSDEDRFYALVGKLVGTEMTPTEVVQLLGYTGNLGRSFKAVVERRSKKYTLPKAIAKLEAKLEERRQSSQQAPAVDDSSTPSSAAAGDDNESSSTEAA